MKKWHQFLREQRQTMLICLDGLQEGSYTITRTENGVRRDMTGPMIEDYKRWIAEIEQLLGDAGVPVEV